MRYLKLQYLKVIIRMYGYCGVREANISQHFANIQHSTIHTYWAYQQNATHGFSAFFFHKLQFKMNICDQFEFHQPQFDDLFCILRRVLYKDPEKTHFFRQYILFFSLRHLKFIIITFIWMIITVIFKAEYYNHNTLNMIDRRIR